MNVFRFLGSFQSFWKFLWPETWHLRHWLNFWQLRTTIWTITLWPLNREWWWWQHSQFLRCFVWQLHPNRWYLAFVNILLFMCFVIFLSLLRMCWKYQRIINLFLFYPSFDRVDSGVVLQVGSVPIPPNLGKRRTFNLDWYVTQVVMWKTWTDSDMLQNL